VAWELLFVRQLHSSFVVEYFQSFASSSLQTSTASLRQLLPAAEAAHHGTRLLSLDAPQ
jgi:hypothetical protein